MKACGERVVELRPIFAQQPIFDVVGVVDVVERDVAEHDVDAVVGVLFVLGGDRPLRRALAS